MRLVLISLFLISFYTKNTIAQIGYMDSMILVELNDDQADSLRNLIINKHSKLAYLDSIYGVFKTSSLELHKLNSIINEFDSLAMNKGLSMDAYRKMTILILENEVQIGYPFILKHSPEFKMASIYNLSDVLKGEIPILLRTGLSDKSKATIFIEYFLNSGYLSKQLSNDELLVIGSIISWDP